MLYRSFRLKQADAELMRAAAARVQISQSEFLRLAIREKAKRVLLDETTLQAVNA